MVWCDRGLPKLVLTGKQNSSVNGSVWRRRLTRYLPVIVWIAVVLFLSTSQGSMSRTSLFIRPLLEFLFPSADETTLQIYHGYIRKMAHVTEYAILAVLACSAFRSSTKHWLASRWWLAALITVLTVASIDEFNQSFNQLRTGQPLDVLLDLAGGTLGLLAYSVFLYNGRIHRNPK